MGIQKILFQITAPQNRKTAKRGAASCLSLMKFQTFIIGKRIVFIGPLSGFMHRTVAEVVLVRPLKAADGDVAMIGLIVVSQWSYKWSCKWSCAKVGPLFSKALKACS